MSRGMALDAIHDLNHAITLRPESSEAYNNRGSAYRVLGQLDNAVQDFNKALEANPNHADALFNRGHVFKETGRLGLAREDFLHACQLGVTEACREYRELAGY
jgi:lipoprotein NlpI